MWVKETARNEEYMTAWNGGELGTTTPATCDLRSVLVYVAHENVPERYSAGKENLDASTENRIL